MNILDKYLIEVGRHLPRKNRADIETEIRSTLEDMLADRSRQAGKPVDEAMTMELLREYGDPAQVAESYAPPRHLIGPRLFPLFQLVTRIVLIVLAAVMTALFGASIISTGLAGGGFLSALAHFLLDLVNGCVIAFGNIVIVFAILERVLPAGKPAVDEKPWDPAVLNHEPDPSQVKPSEAIATIFFTLAGLVIFNLYPQIVGFGFVDNGEWRFIPVLSDAFFRYLPFINVLGVLQIVFNILLVREGTWNTGTRFANLVLETAGIALAIAMLRGPSLISIPANALPAATASEALGNILQFIPAIILVILIVVQTIEVIQTIIKLARGFQRPYHPLQH